MQWLVLAQAFCVGLLGIALALPASFGSAGVLQALGARIMLPAWMLGGAAALTMAMALFAGLVSLRALRRVEPIALLR